VLEGEILAKGNFQAAKMGELDVIESIVLF